MQLNQSPQTVIANVMDSTGAKSAAIIFSTPYESAEAALRALLAEGFKSKLSQSFMKYYEFSELLDTEDAIMFMLSHMHNIKVPDRVSQLCSVISVISEELNDNNPHIISRKFKTKIFPEFLLAATEILTSELEICRGSLNQTLGQQIARAKYMQLNHASKIINPKIDLYDTVQKHLSLRISHIDAHGRDIEFAAFQPDTKIIYSELNKSGSLHELTRILTRISNNELFNSQYETVLNGITYYITDKLPLARLLTTIVAVKKDDRQFIDAWAIEDVCKYLNYATDGFLLCNTLLYKLWEGGCRGGKGYRANLAKPVQNWIARSLFLHLHQVNQTEIQHDKSELASSINSYLLKYRGVWGIDPPFQQLGKQLQCLVTGLVIKLKLSQMLQRRTLQENCKTTTQQYQVYLDYISDYNYNFEAEICPSDFETLHIRRREKPREAFNEFIKNSKNGNTNGLIHKVTETKTIRELLAHRRFAESLQHFMDDGELLIPEDASFMCFEY